MALDASVTRERLLQEGERLFARHGIHAAQIRDVVRAAGQANDSAVHYHFGSRDGLLLAVCRRHVEEMEPARQRRLEAQPGDPSLDRVVADLVEPTAELLRTQSGRDFLRIMAQLAGYSGVRTGVVPEPVAGTALLAQLDQITRQCRKTVPRAVALERVAFMIGALTASLADRARAIEAGERARIGHASYVANLEAMLVAALAAKR